MSPAMTWPELRPIRKRRSIPSRLCDPVRDLSHLLLNAQCRQTGPSSMVFVRDRCTEDRHDAVAGELVDGAAVPLHHSSGVIDKFGHDLAEAFRTHGRGDVHRVHDIGEQHRHLLVFRRSGGLRERRTALAAELRGRAQPCAARPT